MTSNIGSQAIQQISLEGGDEAQTRDAVKEVLQSHFLPEFLNRIDETIIFHPLGRKEVRKIVEFQVEHLKKQLEAAGLNFEISDKAIDAIANQGYDPVFGARPLKRVIQQKVQNPLATEILKGEFEEGSVVRIDFRDDEFQIEKTELAGV
jgi:ATP-dependent Clp protease ATP-binding subunit ClpB